MMVSVEYCPNSLLWKVQLDDLGWATPGYSTARIVASGTMVDQHPTSCPELSQWMISQWFKYCVMWSDVISVCQCMSVSWMQCSVMFCEVMQCRAVVQFISSMQLVQTSLPAGHGVVPSVPILTEASFSNGESATPLSWASCKEM